MRGVNREPREKEVRERLFRVLSEFPVLYSAKHGIGTKLLNPFQSLEKAVKAHVNPLILQVNDLLQEIREGLPYLEALSRVVLFALRHPRRDVVLQAVEKLAAIEGERPYFLWGLAWLLKERDLEARSRVLREAHRKLHMWNGYYTRRFGTPGEVDLIPWRVQFAKESEPPVEGSYRYPTRAQLEVFRNALHCLAQLLRERCGQGVTQWPLRNRILKEMEEVARLLFGYGYTVEEICGRLKERDSFLPDFLNGILLGELETSASKKMELEDVSRHITSITLMDFSSVVPFRSFYCRPSQLREAMKLAKEAEKRLGVKLYRRVLELYERYRSSNLNLLAYYLEYRFQRAHGDYIPPKGPEHLGVKMTEKFVLKYFDQESAQEKAVEEVRRSYGSKSSEELEELLKLLISALSKPDMVRGKKVDILGHIQSGAMGRVLLGIYKGNIVALKEAMVPPGSRMPLSEKVRQLEYEARIHSHVQEEGKEHENIVECYGIVEEEGKKFLAIGYHPAETLGALTKRVRQLRDEQKLGDRDGILSLGDLRTIGVQLLRALLHLRERRVIHRDLKPANVLYLVDESGRVSLIKLIDFGVALGLSEGMPRDLFARQVVGTMAYMAPEASIGKNSYASDLYSVGVILYQLMSGRLPLELERPRSKEDLRRQLRRVATEKRPELAKMTPQLATYSPLIPIAELIDSMIRLDPTERPPVDVALREWEEMWGMVPEELAHLTMKEILSPTIQKR